MADDIKKISVDEFESAVWGNYEPTTTIEWNGIDVEVKYVIGLEDAFKFVDFVTRSCFTDGGVEYFPEAKDFAVRSCIIEYYTNITLPDDLNKRYDLLYLSNIIEMVLPSIKRGQFDSIIKAIEEKTMYLAKSNIEALRSQMLDLYTAVDSIREQMERIFSGVNNDELKGFLGALEGRELNETKIVDAIMKNKKEDDK